MHLTANISVPQKNFIAIDLHSDNAVICVRRNALNKAGELVGKNIWCGRVSIRDGLDNFIKAKRFCRTARISITLPWSNPLTNGIAWQMSLKSAVGCFALRIQAPSVNPHGMRVRKMDLIDRPC